MLSDEAEVPQSRVLLGSARTSEFEMVNSSGPRNHRVLRMQLHVHPDSTATAPTATFDRSGGTSALLRYNVEIKPRTSSPSGVVGSSPAITPQPFLGQFAPFPYGTAPVPSTWESGRENFMFLSVPPLYDSNKADQVDEQESPHDEEILESYPGAPFLEHSTRPPMSLTRRLRGLMVYEARISHLGRMLTAEQVEVDDVAGFLRQRAMDDAPVIEFLASEKQRRKRKWFYDHHQDVSPPSEDVLSHVHQLSSTYEVVRLRVWVKVALADDKTRGDFMTALHSFYLDTLPHSLSVDVLGQDHTVAVTRSEAGLPRYFRVLRKVFLVSTYLTLSWIPRIVVLLFYPHLVDPAFSPVYCHRKRLVSRVADTLGAAPHDARGPSLFSSLSVGINVGFR